MATPTVVGCPNSIKDLKRQTPVTALTDNKRFFCALANRPPGEMQNPVPLAGGHRVSKAVKAAKPDAQHDSGDRSARQPSPAHELRDLARAVRRIGCGFRTDPEAIAITKDEIARKLALVARRLDGAA